jgi:hypothetical protein
MPERLAVILFDGQLLPNPELLIGDPFTKKVKAESGEIVQLMVSLNVISICVPDADTVADANVGRAVSIVELFVTDRAVNETESLPSAS